MKRARVETASGPADEVAVPSSKRQRQPASPARNGVSTGLYQSMKEKHGLDIPFQQFIGVCAYLVVLFTWGLTLEEREMDRFVCLYPTFHDQLPVWETHRAADPSRTIPSYHQWFQQQSPSADKNPRHQVLNEAALRSIWREHPFTFLRAELSLDYMVGLKRRNKAKFGRPAAADIDGGGPGSPGEEGMEELENLERLEAGHRHHVEQANRTPEVEDVSHL